MTPIACLIFVWAVTGSLARADLAPHPTSNFELVWSGPPTPIVNASLFECRDRNCAAPHALPVFACTTDHCLSRYGGNGLYRLVIEFEDRTRTSNVFEKTGFETTYVVRVEPDALVVELAGEHLPYRAVAFIANFLRATLITLAIEFPIVYLLLERWKVRYRKRLIVYANVMTLPIVWLLIISFDVPATVAGVELTVIVAEAVFYWRTMRAGGLTLGRAFTASGIANAGSIATPFAFTYVAMRFGVG
jgi:hypothetical protein